MGLPLVKPRKQLSFSSLQQASSLLHTAGTMPSSKQAVDTAAHPQCCPFQASQTLRSTPLAGLMLSGSWPWRIRCAAQQPGGYRNC
jgi:hypothetical protein